MILLFTLIVLLLILLITYIMNRSKEPEKENIGAQYY